MVHAGSSLPRKQRKAMYTADQHERRSRMGVTLSRELRSRYGRRRIAIHKGDTVRVTSGSYVGREERVTHVDYRSYRVILDNITVKKADGKMKQLPLSTVHLMLTKLDLTDPWRRRILKSHAAAEEEPEAGETGETAETEEKKEAVSPVDAEQEEEK